MKKSQRLSFAPFKRNLSWIGLTLVVSASLIALTVLFHWMTGADYGELTRDPTALGQLPAYYGFLSQIGIFFWSASAAVCLFCLFILSERKSDENLKRFLLVSALLTSVLGLDDVFTLHESVFPGLGIPQNLVLASYVAFAIIYLVRFYSIILETEYVLLAMALLFFAVSVGLDVWEPRGIDRYIFEDGAKLVGQVSWLAYFFRAGNYAIRPIGAK